MRWQNMTYWSDQDYAEPVLVPERQVDLVLQNLVVDVTP